MLTKGAYYGTENCPCGQPQQRQNHPVQRPHRILVQVKSQDSDIKETTIQSLKGAMREGDYGLFVTLSNYTKNAQKYLENTPIIRGINGTELVELVLKYYDHLSDKYRKMIPLKMVYIPVPSEA